VVAPCGYFFPGAMPLAILISPLWGFLHLFFDLLLELSAPYIYPEKGNHKGKGQPQGKRATTREKGNHKGKGQPQGIAPTISNGHVGAILYGCP